MSTAFTNLIPSAAGMVNDGDHPPRTNKNKEGSSGKLKLKDKAKLVINAQKTMPTKIEKAVEETGQDWEYIASLGNTYKQAKKNYNAQQYKSQYKVISLKEEKEIQRKQKEDEKRIRALLQALETGRARWLEELKQENWTLMKVLQQARFAKEKLLKEVEAFERERDALLANHGAYIDKEFENDMFHMPLGEEAANARKSNNDIDDEDQLSKQEKQQRRREKRHQARIKKNAEDAEIMAQLGLNTDDIDYNETVNRVDEEDLLDSEDEEDLLSPGVILHERLYAIAAHIKAAHRDVIVKVMKEIRSIEEAFVFGVEYESSLQALQNFAEEARKVLNPSSAPEIKMNRGTSTISSFIPSTKKECGVNTEVGGANLNRAAIGDIDNLSELNKLLVDLNDKYETQTKANETLTMKMKNLLVQNESMKEENSTLSSTVETLKQANTDMRSKALSSLAAGKFKKLVQKKDSSSPEEESSRVPPIQSYTWNDLPSNWSAVVTNTIQAYIKDTIIRHPLTKALSAQTRAIIEEEIIDSEQSEIVETLKYFADSPYLAKQVEKGENEEDVIEDICKKVFDSPSIDNSIQSLITMYSSYLRFNAPTQVAGEENLLLISDTVEDSTSDDDDDGPHENELNLVDEDDDEVDNEYLSPNKINEDYEDSAITKVAVNSPNANISTMQINNTNITANNIPSTSTLSGSNSTVVVSSQSGNNNNNASLSRNNENSVQEKNPSLLHEIEDGSNYSSNINSNSINNRSGESFSVNSKHHFNQNIGEVSVNSASQQSSANSNVSALQQDIPQSITSSLGTNTPTSTNTNLNISPSTSSDTTKETILPSTQDTNTRQAKTIINRSNDNSSSSTTATVSSNRQGRQGRRRRRGRNQEDEEDE